MKYLFDYDSINNKLYIHQQSNFYNNGICLSLNKEELQHIIDELQRKINE